MENRDLVQQLAEDDVELKRLLEEHEGLEQRLDSLGKLRYLTPEEAMEQRTLKKRKLVGRDRIEAILAEHRA